MPRAPRKPCAGRRCPLLVESGTRYCQLCLKELRRQADASRPTAVQRGYGARWRKVRLLVLFEEPLCRQCDQPSTVVDHITPHRGNPGLMWGRENMQGLCKQCHDRKTATTDGGFGRRA